MKTEFISRKIFQSTQNYCISNIIRFSTNTYLNNFKYECRVLEIIFQWEMNLSNVLGGFWAVDVHVDHRHASILQDTKFN